MKIACIGTGWYPQHPGGLEKYVFGLTRALIDAGDEVDLFVNGEPTLRGSGARSFSIGTAGEPLWKRMRDARVTFANSLHGPYDAINIHFAMNALPLIPFIKHDTPRVIHFHGPWAAESRAEGSNAFAAAIKERLERFVYSRADRFVVLSSAFKNLLMQYGVDSARITVIPMGIDCTAFVPPDDRTAVRAALGWPDSETIFFTARRLVNRVGLHELLQATRLLRRSHANFRVKIAGKGPLQAELEAAVDVLELGDIVELMGFIAEDKLVSAYQAADVTILPTQSLEGFGTVIGESLACATPVIVTPVGGMPEAVVPLQADLVARTAAPGDIAERMSAVMDGRLRLPERSTCRAYALEHFDWPTVAEGVRSVFATSRRTRVPYG